MDVLLSYHIDASISLFLLPLPFLPPSLSQNQQKRIFSKKEIILNITQSYRHKTVYLKYYLHYQKLVLSSIFKNLEVIKQSMAYLFTGN